MREREREREGGSGGGGGPTAFKRSEVIPFPKTKTIFTDLPLPKTKTISTDLNDYRSISILSILTKLLERHIHKHERPFGNTSSFPFFLIWLTVSA